MAERLCKIIYDENKEYNANDYKIGERVTIDTKGENVSYRYVYEVISSPYTELNYWKKITGKKLARRNYNNK